MRANHFAWRLPQSLLTYLREAAAEDGVAMNQYIAVALAEKLASRRTAKLFLADRAAHGSLTRALDILERAGTDEDETTLVASFAQTSRAHPRSADTAIKGEDGKLS